VDWAITDKGYSQRRACSLVGLDRKTYRYASRRPADEAMSADVRQPNSLGALKDRLSAYPVIVSSLICGFETAGQGS